MKDKEIHTPSSSQVYCINNPLIMTMDDLLPEDCFEELNNEVDKYCKFTKSSVVGPKGKSVQDRKRTSQTGNTLNSLFASNRARSNVHCFYDGARRRGLW